MFDTGIKKTLCTICIHREVCMHKQDYLDILKAVENAATTKNTSKEASRYAFISEIHVGCKYYRSGK